MHSKLGTKLLESEKKMIRLQSLPYDPLGNRSKQVQHVYDLMKNCKSLCKRIAKSEKSDLILQWVQGQVWREQDHQYGKAPLVERGKYLARCTSLRLDRIDELIYIELENEKLYFDNHNQDRLCDSVIHEQTYLREYALKLSDSVQAVLRYYLNHDYYHAYLSYWLSLRLLKLSRETNAEKKFKASNKLRGF